MKHIKDFFKNNFIAGFLLLVPIGATFTLFRYIITKSDQLWKSIPATIRPDAQLGIELPGLSLILAFLFVVLIGFLGRMYVIRFFISIGDRIIRKIPFISGVYSAIKQLLDTMFMSHAGKETRKVVMIEYPRKGVYSIAFVTSESRGETQEKTDQKMVNIFIPTTPNPTSGFFLMIPEGDVTPLDMNVEEAFKLIISGGIVSPQQKT